MFTNKKCVLCVWLYSKHYLDLLYDYRANTIIVCLVPVAETCPDMENMMKTVPNYSKFVEEDI